MSASKPKLLVMEEDFNLQKVQWLIDDEYHDVLMPNVFGPPISVDFISGVMVSGAHQVNHIRSSSDTLLDLFFTNDSTNASIEHANREWILIIPYLAIMIEGITL